MKFVKPVTIYIEQLGPIKDSTITLKPFMVLSGDSGLGKSYTAFLIHYIYVLLCSNRLDKFLEKEGFDSRNINTKNNQGELGDINTTTLTEWINTDAVEYIGYLIGNSQFAGKVKFNISFSKDSLSFKYKEELSGINGQENRYISIFLEELRYRTPINGIASLEKDNPFTLLLCAYIKKELLGNYYKAFNRTLMLPPSRGAFTGLTLNSRDELRSSIGMYKEYLRDMDMIEEASENKTENSFPEIIEMMQSINNGTIKRDSSNKLMYETKDVQIPVTAAASSIKELAPLALFIEKYSLHDSSILFEEPEAHIHPGRQVQLADLMVAMVNQKAHFQITTHSDYVLRRINDLINLYKLKEKDSDKYQSFIEEKGYKKDLVLNPDDVGAYYFHRNNDDTASIRQQSLEEGIPYDSFHEVISKDMMNSMYLKRLLAEKTEGEE
jgi:predicted ATPase